MSYLNLKSKSVILKFIVIPFFVGLFFCLPILNGNIYTGYDFSFHMSRLSGIRSSISDMQFPLAVYTNKNYGFGYAGPLFYCDLFLILPVMLNYIGVSYRCIYILIVALSNVAGCVVLLTLLYKRTNNYLNSFLVLLAFEFSTLHILDTYRRSALGTITAWVFIFLVVYLSYRIFEDKITNTKISIYLGISFAGILLCHNLSFALTCFAFGLICLFNIKNLNKETLLCILKAIIVALLLSAFFLFPMIEQMLDGDFMYSHYSVWYKSNLTLKNLFNNFIVSDLDIYTPGVIAILTTIVALFKKKRISELSFKLAIINIILIFLSTDLSPLTFIKQLSFIQFPYRLSYIVICTSPFILLDLIKSITIPKYLIIIYIGLLVANFYFSYSLLYSDPDCIWFKDESIETLHYVHKEIRWDHAELSNAEYLPQTEDMNYSTSNGCVMHSNLDDLECYYDRKGSKIEVTLDNEFDDNIMFPLSYYKGYSVYELVDGEKKKLDVNPAEYYKLISVYSPKGEHTYITKYEGTVIQKISLAVSLISVASIGTYLVSTKKKLID